MSIRLALALLLPTAFGASPAPTFAEFRALFTKKYATSSEEAKRAAIFDENVQTIQRLNEIERSAQPGLIGDVYGVTQFMDLAPEEFSAAYKGFRSAKPPRPMLPKSTPKPRASNTSDVLQRKGLLEGGDQAYSWCPKYCTPIKQQGRCGDCWAFAAVEQMESMAMLNGISVPALSPQQMADCDSKDDGCQGGLAVSGWEYAMSNPIESVADYPITSTYSGKTGTCHSSGSGILRATKVIEIDHTEQAMADYVTGSGPGHGPLAIGVDANNWQFYTGGRKAGDPPNGDPGCNCISAATCGSNVDHAVQLTGFTLDASKYLTRWEIRNQWGTQWGCNGFACLTAGEDTCKITSDPASVGVESASAWVPHAEVMV